ncbi:MAG: ice-binding family protein [Verrucomicrobiota bacterium]
MHRDASAAQAPVPLGTTVTFGVLGAATVTSTGATIIYGDLGVSPGTAVTGSPGVTGRLHVSDAAAALAQSDLTKAYNDAAGRTTGSVTVAGNLGGQTLAPGLYVSSSSLAISSGDLTLAGDANAVWIFQMGSTLTTTTGRQVILSGGAQSANIFWQVGSSATIGVSSVFKGTIMAAQSITMDTGATLEGRALAKAGAVTLDANTITVPQSANPAGTVVAWGNDDYGETNMPAGLSTLTAVTAGESYTVALKSDGTVVAWGNDDYGQSDAPPGLSNVTAIAAGEYHTVALKRDGTVAAWGNDDYGQCLIPAGLSGVTAIAAGQWHTLVLKSDGTVAGWGSDAYGQTDVPAGLSNVTAITGGSGHSMALLSNGTVVAWGANSFFGQCNIPIGLSGVTAIAAGSSHSVALQSDGTVVAWGNNLFGQTTIPTGLTGVTAIAAGEFHTVALKSDGTVVEWGWNADGETTVPSGLGGVTAIAAGWTHTAALIGPIITTQPLAQTFALGGGVNLSVSANGSGLSYQWQFDHTNISGATNSTLNLMNLSGANVGAYRVVVSSAAGGTVTGQDTILSSLFFGNLNFYAGITLAGTVGQQFRVDYADALTPGTTNWQVLETITLPFSPYLVIDPNSPGHAQRFYRAVPML